ncbi:MAG: 4-hydroxythreonine-4-phosphate dehydrogenase PdxA [Nitrospira sp.]|nr:4-hydroxythreonine-4-phosphate dehydrogenase PdxA [Nitrospira sp.]
MSTESRSSRTRSSSPRLPLLGITMGDPAGIGPEVIAKALSGAHLHNVCRSIVIGSLPVMERTIKALKLKLKLDVVRVHGHGTTASRRGTVAVLDPLETPLRTFKPGIAAAETGAASVAFIKNAVELAQIGCIDGVVTAPINKEAINMAGCRYPGHTELLADLTRAHESGMMIVGGPLRIMFVTTHVAIRDLSLLLTQAKIEKAIRLAQLALTTLFGIKRPRIGVAALNPHAGEHGLFGDEEARIILPAARASRQEGILASDPLPADTLFGKAAKGSFDGVVALYHDQGLIPLKLVAFGTCVNLTVGLPIIRTSVDHGTAFDIVGQGIADPGSLIAAVKLAAGIARNRTAATPTKTKRAGRVA